MVKHSVDHYFTRLGYGRFGEPLVMLIDVMCVEVMKGL